MSAFDDLVMEVKLLKNIIAELHADNEAFCDAIESYLDTEGYKVSKVTDVWIAEWKSPDLIDTCMIGVYDNRYYATIAALFDCEPKFGESPF